MPKKRHESEEIIAKLRQVDVLVLQGQSVADAIRSIGGQADEGARGWRMPGSGAPSRT